MSRVIRWIMYSALSGCDRHHGRRFGNTCHFSNATKTASVSNNITYPRAVCWRRWAEGEGLPACQDWQHHLSHESCGLHACTRVWRGTTTRTFSLYLSLPKHVVGFGAAREGGRASSVEGNRAVSTQEAGRRCNTAPGVLE